MLLNKEIKTNQILDSLISFSVSPNFIDKTNNSLGGYVRDLSDKDDITLLVFENDTLIYWSDNKVPIFNYLEINTPDVLFNNRLVLFQNGWYEVVSKTFGNKIFVGLILVKNQYSYQNHHLKNQFQKEFNLPDNIGISLNEKESSKKVFSKKGVFLFALIDQRLASLDIVKTTIIILLYLAALICFLFLFRVVYLFLKLKFGTYLVLFFSLLFFICLRLLMLALKFPEKLYQLPLFSPVNYASSFVFSSLGDFLLNALMLLAFSILFYKSFNPDLNILPNKLKQYVIGLVLLLLPISFAKIIEELLQDLIQNSSFSLDLNQVFSLGLYSLLGFLSIGILFISFIIIAYKSIVMLKKNEYRLGDFLIVLSVLFFGLAFYQWQGLFDFIVSLWPFILLLVIWRYVHSRLLYNNLMAYFLIVIFVFAAFTTYKLTALNKLKEQKSRVFLAQKIGKEKDHVLEYLFTQIESQIINDDTLSNDLLGYWANKNIIDNYIRDNYFQGYWQKYDVQITSCNSNDSLYINSDKNFTDCQLFFENIIQQFGTEINRTSLYYLSNNSGRISYLAHLKIPITKSKYNRSVDLYIEFDSKFMPAGGGYPELLLNINEELAGIETLGYSFAKFKNHNLISKSGSFNYSFSDYEFNFSPSNASFQDKNQYSHLLYPIDHDSLIVVSLKSNNWLDYLTSFSFVFGFYSLLLLFIMFVKQLPDGLISSWLELKNRIPILIIGIILFSLLTVGFGSVYFIKSQYKEKNFKVLNEKIKSVLIELQQKTNDIGSVKEKSSEFFSFFLVKFSNVFFSDINLYDLNGDLISSSRKEIFDLGLIDKKMNAKAYRKMRLEGRTEYIQEEEIGNLTYLSAYTPVRSVYGENIAYLNLPYFAKQHDLEAEISVFLAALINMYMVLFVFSAIIALVISRYITEPLQLIKSKLANVKLGKINELIQWQRKDEIGNLIQEYNRMIQALSESAEKLAKSERESAWREMAKQVAHEIKNPLTPIKLGAQHIERAWKDKAPDFDLRLEKYIKTLTEQIDALAHIATEFSNFAQMPKTKNEILNLADIIENVMVLFNDNENLSVQMVDKKPTLHQLAIVYADKDQIIRILNNLIQNGIQSVSDVKKPCISISLENNQNSIIIAVKDNGQGISSDLHDKIFEPNFTTKNNGMGLGLAMVKNIVENLGGKIWFSTSQGQGSTFFVSLPLFQN